jgi:hypothetical protein
LPLELHHQRGGPISACREGENTMSGGKIFTAIAVGAFALLATATPLRAASKQEQIDSNTQRIESLEQKTTLSDLPCEHDEVAVFDGTQWVCRTTESLHPAVYQVARTVTIITFPDTQATSFWDAFCDPGDQVISGGFQIPPSPVYSVPLSHASTQIDSFGRTRSTWRVGIRADADTPALSAQVFAYCLDLTR